LQVTSGLRPGSITSSGNVSWHARGRALDVSGPKDAMLRFARHASRAYGGRLEELIHTPLGRAQIKNGQSYVYTGQVAADHYDHVHIADAQDAPANLPAAGSLTNGGPNGLSGSSLRVPRLKNPGTSLGGLPGAMVNTVSANYADAMTNALQKMVNGGGAPMGGGVSQFDHVFARHFSGQPGVRLSPAQVAAIASSVGLPGRTFAQIAHGESDYYPGIQQRDPGDGMVGYGLFQNTPNAWGRGSAAYKYMQSLGGIPAMFNPIKNAMMAKYLYDHAGHSIRPWYGTRYVGDGEGIEWGGWNAKGGSFKVNKPTIFGAGESGEETVHIVPKGKTLHGGVHIGTLTIEYRGEGDVRDAILRELEQVGAAIDQADLNATELA
jgi:hypothetical protein